MLVVVLGASPNPDRYSNKAIRMLQAHRHQVVPVNPGHQTIEGLAVVASVRDVSQPIDTLTVYVSPQHIGPLVDDIIAVKPRRIVANPGAESNELAIRARAAGIDYVEACTLVMLSTGQF